MSDAIYSHLPRFDAPREIRAADWQKPLSAGSAPVADISPAAEDKAVHAAARPETSAAAPPSQAPDAASMQKTVTDLAGLMGRVERESREQVTAVVQSMAGQLFPALSRQFLAEEIGRHLPRLVPVVAPSVSIRTRPELASQLEDMVAAHPSLAGRCEVIAVEGQASIDVSWRTGGVTFDFDELLRACLAQLSPAHKTKVEQM